VLLQILLSIFLTIILYTIAPIAVGGLENLPNYLEWIVAGAPILSTLLLTSHELTEYEKRRTVQEILTYLPTKTITIFFTSNITVLLLTLTSSLYRGYVYKEVFQHYLEQTIMIRGYWLLTYHFSEIFRHNLNLALSMATLSILAPYVGAALLTRNYIIAGVYIAEATSQHGVMGGVATILTLLPHYILEMLGFTQGVIAGLLFYKKLLAREQINYDDVKLLLLILLQAALFLLIAAIFEVTISPLIAYIFRNYLPSF